MVRTAPAAPVDPRVEHYGVATQRTRLHRSELSIEWGLFAALTRGPATLSVYGVNLDGESPFAIVTVGIGF